MSAYLVETESINLLANYFIRMELHHQYEYKGYPHFTDTVKKVGQILLSENIDSVNHRYPDNYVDPIEFFPSQCSMNSFEEAQIIKSAECLNYQSCEHPEYNDSIAKTILKSIVWEAVFKLENVKKAEWK